MAVFNKQGLITELLDRIELIKARTQPFLRLSEDQLNYSTDPRKWSIAGIFQHLNLANGYYIRSILSQISNAPDVKTDTFRSGWFGEWCYGKIMPRADGSVFKMKTPKTSRPPEGILDGIDALNRFLQQCDMLDDLLRHASSKDLQYVKVPLSMTKLMQFRLGDILRILIAHDERHLLQAHRVKERIQ